MRKRTPKPHQRLAHRILIDLSTGIFVISIVFGLGGLHHPELSVSPPLIVAPNPAAATPTPTAIPTPSPLPPVVATAAPTLAIAPTPIPAVPVTPAATKHPNLPDYPHPIYEYSAVALPSGPLYSMEGFLGRISASTGFAAASAAPGNTPVTVAVIDTGFALNHDLLAGRWATNPAESGAAATDGLDNDNDGFIDNFRGWDFRHSTNDPSAGTDDPDGTSVTHGTLTAGLATLLNPDNKIMPLQALSDDGYGNTDDVSAAIRYAADHGAKIISLSLGATLPDNYLHDQITYAASKGALVIAASGNSGCNCMLYPANYPEVLAVGASTSTDSPAYFSSYGANLDILAPGTAGDVCSSAYSSSDPTSGYTCGYSGTSLATPVVSGLASLLAQQCPYCTAATISQAILVGADTVAGMNGAARTNTTGYGRLNVNGAVNAITGTLTADFNHDNRVNVYDLSRLLASWGQSNSIIDLNNDGIIDVLDLAILIASWQP